MLQPWQLGDRVVEWGKRTYLMGILNVTPDSFSDGGLFNTVDAAIVQAKRMLAAGADFLDIGGQSTRPNAETISLTEELDRVIPVVKALRQSPEFDRAILSIDTTRSAVAEAAIAAGANVINDISGGTFDQQMLPTIARLGVPVILMHLRGTPATMQQLTDYQDLMGEILEFLRDRIDAAVALGIPRHHLCIDPGIGFAKTAEQNLELLRQTSAFKTLHCPVLVGTSRKSFIGKILDRPDPTQRVWGTAATCCAAIAGGADILRVHDVAEMADVLRVADAIWR